jgi:peptide-methionine (S)-S-oxide reductase
MAEFRTIFPAETDFIASTAAARVNGYLAGYGSLEQLRTELITLELSPAIVDRLVELIAQGGDQ